MLIAGRPVSPEIVEKVRAVIAAHPGASRTQLSVRVCEAFDWRDHRGQMKDSSCRIALLGLHKQGRIELPEPRRSMPQPWVPEAVVDNEAPEIRTKVRLSALGVVELQLVEDPAQSRVWNDLLTRHHDLGAGPLCGARLRYLIRSEQFGWVGGLAFSSAAWRLAPRDGWIGWDDQCRRERLSRVVCNSRFLLVPWLEVRNLASHVLSLAAARVVGDWSQRYGIEPVLLETFVARERFAGTCYRAANWLYLGITAGRGRQDRAHEASAGVKDVYVLPLQANARDILVAGGCATKKSVSVARTPVDWADEEFGTAELGDERLRRRLLTIARDWEAQPQANIPQACGSRAKTKAAYRFFAHEQTTMKNLLQPHQLATINRAKSHDVILAVQDTTYLNYSHHPALEDMGPIGTKAKGGPMGLVVHDTMAFSTDGVPLGLLDVQCWARDPATLGKKLKRVPIEQKESYKWLASYQAATIAQQACPQTQFVSVGDRESDIYELFVQARETVDGPAVLVRAEQNRLVVAEQGHLWAVVESQPVAGLQVIHVPRQGKRAARVAPLEVRFARIELRPPDGKKKMGNVTVWAIQGREIDVPAGIEPLEWMLVTTLPVATFEQATEKLDWYARRWGIEVFHRTLKSGLNIEQRQLGVADRIEACLAIDMVVAWRIFYLTKLGRETPNVPCTVFFDDAEWKALVAFHSHNPIPPIDPPSLREATRMVGALGGFLGRKCDGEPGTKSLWLGLQRLDDMTSMYKVLVATFSPSINPKLPPVSSNPGYG